MAWIQLMAMMPSGHVGLVTEVWAPLTVEHGFVSATIVPADVLGPADVPCEHQQCRESLAAAEECAAEAMRLEESRYAESDSYDGWAL